jgi:hypothetical protein
MRGGYKRVADPEQNAYGAEVDAQDMGKRPLIRKPINARFGYGPPNPTGGYRLFKLANLNVPADIWDLQVSA